MPSLALLSDTHLERYDEVPDRLGDLLAAAAARAPTLVLAGDIGDPAAPLYETFLGRASAAFADVVLVAGNHEYPAFPPGRSGPPTDAALAALAAAFPNVHYLQRAGVRAGGCEFLGCTLWAPPANIAALARRVRRPGPADVAALRALHERDAAWLDAALPERRGARALPVVVVTHHLPTTRLLAPKHVGSPAVSLFASDCEELVARADAWLCGHSHAKARRLVRGCVCAMNPFGYPGESTGVTAGLVTFRTRRPASPRY